MSNFNLKDYETVKSRKKKFLSDYPDGSLITDIIFHERDHVIIKGSVYKTKEDQEKNLPTGTGHAEEFQGQNGFANKYAWMENCDESAIGRALDNAGYSGNNKCSQEEMKKVKNKEETPKTKTSPAVQHKITGETAKEFFKSLPEFVKHYSKSKNLTSIQLSNLCEQHDWNIDKISTAISKKITHVPEEAQLMAFWHKLPDFVASYLDSAFGTGNEKHAFCAKHNWDIPSIDAAVTMLQGAKNDND